MRADGKPWQSRLQRAPDMFPATGFATPSSEARRRSTQKHKGSLKAFSRSFGGQPRCLAERERSAFGWDPHPTLRGASRAKRRRNGWEVGGGGELGVEGVKPRVTEINEKKWKSKQPFEEHVSFPREKDLLMGE